MMISEALTLEGDRPSPILFQYNVQEADIYTEVIVYLPQLVSAKVQFPWGFLIWYRFLLCSVKILAL